MIAKIAKMLRPSPSRLARMAAGKVQEIANVSDKFAAVAKYSVMADEALEICRFLKDIAEAVRIADTERDKIAERLTPLFARLMAVI